MLVQNLPLPLDRRVWQEALVLRDAGLDVVAICPRGKERHSEPYEQIDGIEIHRYPPRPSAGGAIGYLLEYASAFRWMRRTIRRLARACSFDVVHAASPPDFLLLTALPLRRRGAKFVFDHHDLSPELFASRYGGGKAWLHRLLLATEKLAFRLADVAIATNESYRRIAIERGGMRPADVFVVRNAPNLDRFDGARPDPALRQGRAHLLAYVGMMGPQDGVDHALRGLAALRSKRDDWHALFLGDGDVVPAMRELTRELGLEDVVTFGGMADDELIGRTLATADICLSPEPSNPLNDVSTMIKVAEYMAAGRPVVAYELPETRATAGEAALYARGNDPADLAERIEVLLSRPDLRESMGALARQTVERALSWDVSRRELESAYRYLLPDRPLRVSTTHADANVTSHAVA